MIFVLYRNPEENLSTEAAQIVEFYAVRSEDLQVIAGDKTGWSVVNSAYWRSYRRKIIVVNFNLSLSAKRRMSQFCVEKALKV